MRTECGVLGTTIFLCGLSALANAEARPSEDRHPHRLRLELQVDQAEVHVGEPLSLRVRFVNDDAEPFFLYRDTDIGVSGAVQIMAKRDGCQYEATPTHFEVAESDWRFFYVPLWPGRGLDETVRLNDHSVPFVDLPLREPGRYSVEARFTLGTKSSAQRPLWEGDARSAPVLIDVKAPLSEVVAARRSGLQRCIAAKCDELDDYVNYFRLVRDQGAAGILVDLLRDQPTPLVAQAVGAQGRKEDATALRAFAALMTGYSRDYYMRLASSLEEPTGCK